MGLCLKSTDSDKVGNSTQAYDWAGEYRNVRTSKGGNTFCLPEFIESEMAKLFHALSEKNYLKGLTPADFVKQAAWFLSELNAIHPFREGNGRVQLAFLDILRSEEHTSELQSLMRISYAVFC